MAKKGWTPAQLRKYKRAKRDLINLVSAGGTVNFHKKRKARKK